MQKLENRLLRRSNKDWSKSKMAKEVRDDLLQNCMLLANGALSITFAHEWNSDNNPLLIIHNKFQDGLTVSVEMLDTTAVAVFADRRVYILEATIAPRAQQVMFLFPQQAQLSDLPGKRRERRRRFRHRPRLVRHQVRGEGRVDEGNFITALHFRQ